MISASDRENAVLLINEAIASGASCKKACWTVWIVNFNTSHVTVYPGLHYATMTGQDDFNTSHVTVYHGIYCIPFRLAIISIHLMLRFIWRMWKSSKHGNHISIHLMLRFIIPGILQQLLLPEISIHLMLRFIFCCIWIICMCIAISIHLMLRFIR